MRVFQASIWATRFELNFFFKEKLFKCRETEETSDFIWLKLGCKTHVIDWNQMEFSFKAGKLTLKGGIFIDFNPIFRQKFLQVLCASQPITIEKV